MKVVTKEGLHDVLLGHDYPGICELIIKAATAAMENENGTDDEIGDPNPIRLEEEVAAPEVAASVPTTVEAESELSDGTQRMEDTAGVQAVTTRAQSRRELQQRQEDDEASAHSDATAVPLMQLDDSLFAESKVKQKLSRQQKRTQAREWVTAAEGEQTNIAALTSQQLRHCQEEDESLEELWIAADEERDGYLVKDNLLQCQGKDEWGEETDRIVVPTKFRQEIIRMAHGDKLSAHQVTRTLGKRFLLARNARGREDSVPVLWSLPTRGQRQQEEGSPAAPASHRRAIPASGCGYSWTSEENKKGQPLHSHYDGLCITVPRGYPTQTH